MLSEIFFSMVLVKYTEKKLMPLCIVRYVLLISSVNNRFATHEYQDQ
jgi:hypothetical protein